MTRAPAATLLAATIVWAACGSQPATVPGVSNRPLRTLPRESTPGPSALVTPKADAHAEPKETPRVALSDAARAWIGEYVAEESCGKDEEGVKRVAVHHVVVREVRGALVAEIIGDGYQLSTHVRGTADATESELVVHYGEPLENNLTDGLEPGVVLVRMARRQPLGLSTSWMALRPICDSKPPQLQKRKQN